VFKYFLKVNLNFAFSFLMIVRLRGKVPKILMLTQNVLFFENKIGCHFVYKDDSYSLH
jgi:hypothetical protein